MSPVPVTVPTTTALDSSPVRIETSLPTAYNDKALRFVPREPALPSLVADLVDSIRNGRRLDRPAEFWDLAEQVTANAGGLPDDWVERLSANLAQCDD